MKPRLFYSRKDSAWVCAEMAPFTEFLAVRCYYQLGTGKTPKEAWDDAFPKSWWQKLKEAFRIVS